MVSRNRVRASGETAGVEAAADAVTELEEEVKVELPEERKFTFRTAGFSRMRTEWRADDRAIIESVQKTISNVITTNFPDALQTMYEIYEEVRQAALDAHNVPIIDADGLPRWERSHSGAYIEDWSSITRAQREHWLFVITTHLFEWEQRAAQIWTEAMFAKAQWEERYSISFEAPIAGTVDDRKAHANVDAADERYFAIFTTSYSRRADALVRSMERIALRLRDSLP